VEVQEVRWVEGDSQPADNYIFFHGNGKANHHLGTGFFVHKGIVSTIKRVEFISDRMPYIIRSKWCDTDLNMHEPTEDEGDDTKDSFYKEFEHVFGHS
jgi:hypothetical protein